MKTEVNSRSQVSLEARRLNTFGSKFSRQKAVFFLLVPGFLWFLVFKYAPMVGAFAAFTDYGTFVDTSFVGFDNFNELFASPDFMNAFYNTIIISSMMLIFYFPLPIVLALLLNEIVFIRLRRLVQFIVYIPHFFSWVVVGAVFSIMLSPSNGFVNQVIEAFGGDAIYFMVTPEWFKSILVTSYIWRDVGYGTIIYIATISTIDVQLYEAATVDGAGYWNKMWHITLPSISSTIATVLLLTLARVMLIFEQVLVMKTAPVNQVSEVLQTYSFDVGLLQGNIGLATAISLFTAVISTLLILGCNLASKLILKKGII